MMNIIPILGIAIVTVLLTSLLRQYRPEYAVAAEIVAVILILILLTVSLSDILSSLRSIMRLSGMENGYLSLLIKALGISILVQLAADTCRDAGNSALAHKVELAGRVGIVLLTMPMILAVAEFAIRLIKG